jgi:hypothetical protein
MRDRFNLAFPSLLLVAVAVVQLVRAHTTGQTSWKGGGFGMFATSDSPQARFVRCTIAGADGKEFRVLLPGRLSQAVILAKIVPSESNVRDLARMALELEWVREDWSPAQFSGADDRDGDGSSAPLPGESAPAGPAGRSDPSFLTYRPLSKSEPRPPAELLLGVRMVRIEVWRMQLDAGKSQMKAVLLRGETVEE